MKTNDSKQPFSSDLSRDMLRRYLEGETTDAENQLVLRYLTDSTSGREELDNVDKYLSDLRNMPRYSPPDHVWNQIKGNIEDVSPRQVWFPWIYSFSSWDVYAKAIPVVLLLLVALGIGNTFLSEPAYDVILVEEANGFSQEAESYFAYHDLSGVPLPVRESVVAFCTNGRSE